MFKYIFRHLFCVNVNKINGYFSYLWNIIFKFSCQTFKSNYKIVNVV